MKTRFLLMMLLAVVMTSCKNNSSKPRGVTARNANGVVSPVFGTGIACQNGQSNIGTIYDQNGGVGSFGAVSFEDRVKALLSASVNPSEIGMISSGPTDPTGVRFQGVIKLDSSGQVVLAQTQMKILVYDSYVLQSQYSASGQKYEPIPIEFTSAVEGRFDLNSGSGYVLFRDQYGDIRFDGRFDAQYFSGTVSFRNTQSVVGGTAAQGTLGQFYVARCGIIQ